MANRLVTLLCRSVLPNVLTVCLLLVAVPASSQETIRTELGNLRAIPVASGLETPWSLAFLPDGRMLVTERPGRMRIVAGDGTLSPPLGNVPAVQAAGQGGLLDVTLGPSFGKDRILYFSFSQPTRRGARTAVARAELDAEGLALRNVTVIFAQNDDSPGQHHWGSRLVFARDGTLFVTLGERFFLRDRAQDLASHLGKVVRIRADGSVPTDNPYVKRVGAAPEIWSYGHRNIQGAALHPQTGELWTHEHGPQGGDEVNVDRPGRNFGWPVITYGREYMTGARIGEGTQRADIEAPVHYWVPSIAPSGMTFYTGEAYPKWKGNLFVGALKGKILVRLELSGERVLREERMLGELDSRIRDVRQGPDGKLYLLDETHGRILKLDPA